MEKIELSLEQQFQLRLFEQQVSQMSQEQAQQFLIMLYRQSLARDVVYQHLLKHRWQIQ